MGLLDTALSILGNNNGGGDSKAALLQAAVGMLSNSSNGGGLQGLIGAFQNAGLGNIMSSWVGTGANLPISAEQLQSALGNGQIQQLAEAAGISHEGAIGHLVDMLPGLVDHLTPNGEVPAAGNIDVGSVLQGLSGLFGKS